MNLPSFFLSHFLCLSSDGTISYEEMLQYFLSANTVLRERFTHRFEEHTFLGTAVCEHCKGMVSKVASVGVHVSR